MVKKTGKESRKDPKLMAFAAISMFSLYSQIPNSQFLMDNPHLKQAYVENRTNDLTGQLKFKNPFKGLKIGNKRISGAQINNHIDNHIDNPIDNTLNAQYDSKEYQVLSSYLGIPYGPRMLNGEWLSEKHLDCVTLIQDYAGKKGVNIPENRGDKIYARHTLPVAHLDREQTSELSELEKIATGDLIFIGHPYSSGEANISAEHLGVVGKPIYGSNGELKDFTMVHASGSYHNKERTSFSGEVSEVSMLDYHKSNLNNPKRDHMYVGRLKK